MLNGMVKPKKLSMLIKLKKAVAIKQQPFL